MQVITQNPEFGLADLGNTLRRRKWVVIITTIVVAGLVLAYTVHKPAVYRSVAGMLIVPEVSSNGSGAYASGGTSGGLNMATQIALINSAPVALKVQQEIGLSPPVAAVQQGETDIINITADASSPAQAARIANAYANAFNAVREDQINSTYKVASAQLESEISNLQTRLGILNIEQNTLQSNPKTSGQALTANEAKINSLETQLSQFQSQLTETQNQHLLNPQVAQLVDPAKPNPNKISPKPKTDALIAVLAGLVLGIGLAFILEFLDDRIRSSEDIERAAGGLPVIGLVPEVGDWRDRKMPYLVSVERPRSEEAEAYRALRTAVQFLTIEESVSVIEITSPASNDGKTATTANLATALAMAGQRCVAVSCDLRRPRLHEFFSISNDIGLTSVLLGEATLAEALWTEPQDGRLHVLPSGPNPPNPSELLAGRGMIEVLEQLRHHADIILLDSAPVLPVTDAAVLAGRADAVILVGRAGLSTRRGISRALENLARVNAPVVGMVLNSVSARDGYGYGSRYGYRYGYGYGYGSYGSYGTYGHNPEAGSNGVTAGAAPGGKSKGRSSSRRSSGTEN